MKRIFICFLFCTLTLSATEVFHLPPGDPRSGPLRVEDFNLITNEFITKVWVHHMQGENLNIVTRFEWENPYLMAGSSRIGSNFTIIFSGAFVRLPLMNRLGVAFILCHELAHLKGGEPRIQADPLSLWASAEGQSDYWAATVCLPEFMQKSASVFKDVLVSKESLRICKDHNNPVVCAQIITSGETFLKATAEWVKAEPVSLTDNWDHSVVDKVNRSYPTPQCRLQTVVHGALQLQRPSCWYSEQP